MNAPLAWQYAIVAVLVAFSALSVLRKYLPSVWGRTLALIAGALESPRLPALLRRRGAALRARIPAKVGSACASSGGCSSCGACGSSADAKPAALPLAEPRPLRRH